MPADDLTKTAYHECGHAVMAVLLGGKIDLLTLEPDSGDDLPERSGEIRVIWPPDTFTDKELGIFEIKVALAGPIAEMIYDGSQQTIELLEEWRHDWEMATDRVAEFLPNNKSIAEHLGGYAFELMGFFERGDVWAAVAGLADQLEAHETLEEEQIADVMAAWPIAGFEQIE
ncbi:MAG: hypothetical protein ACKVJU_01815 [Verrucomicrobiales bacterium]